MTYYKVYFDKTKREFIRKEYTVQKDEHEIHVCYILTDKKTGITQQIDRLDFCRVFPDLLIGVGTNIIEIMNELNKLKMSQEFANVFKEETKKKQKTCSGGSCFE